MMRLQKPVKIIFLVFLLLFIYDDVGLLYNHVNALSANTVPVLALIYLFLILFVIDYVFGGGSSVRT